MALENKLGLIRSADIAREKNAQARKRLKMFTLSPTCFGISGTTCVVKEG